MRRQRGLKVVGALLAWWWLTMFDASPNTFWERHSFAGPFALLHHSHTSQDFWIAIVLFATILVPALVWAWNDSKIALTLAILAAGGNMFLSIQYALSAGC
ncbi:MAG: hypothetical protein K8U03_13730 [Planctomycetia bacterium]|nr:hypothetical protein [Planctomycetia bacterium]